MLLESTQFDPIRFCVFFFVFVCFVFFFVVVFLVFFRSFHVFEKNFNDLTVITFLGRQQFFSATCVKKKEIMIMTMKFHYFKNAAFFSLLRNQYSLQAI